MALIRSTLGCIAAALTFAAGSCVSHSGLVGSWTGDGTHAERPFTFGAVAFRGDGTFSAEARYGDVTRIQTGTWTIDADRVIFIEDDRTYLFHVMGDTVDFTDPKTGNTMRLVRTR